jgi:hypothetical protein
MSVSKADVILLGNSVEHKIAALDLKGTSKEITQALIILRTEFGQFITQAS